MPYAVNIADFTGQRDDWGLGLLLAPVIDERAQTVEINSKRFDAVGARLICDEERAEAITKLVRHRYKRHQLRLYYSKTGKGGWKRI